MVLGSSEEERKIATLWTASAAVEGLSTLQKMSPASLSSILPTPPQGEYKEPRLLTPRTNAIPLISGQNGRTYSTLHTVAVMMLFMLQFRYLVTRPYRTMVLDLGPLMLLQCVYCVACLPSTGTWSNTIGNGSGITVGSHLGKPTKGGGTGSSRKRHVGLGRTGLSESGGWKGMVMVSVSILTVP